MNRQAFQRVVRFLHGLARQPATGSDADLLHAYAAARDEAAFAELLRRHGPLVWGVCRRLLRTEQDAEDAFQATFLVLARKAASIRKGDSLGCWLYGVARRVSRARGLERGARSGIPSTELRAPSSGDPAAQVASAELCEAILDEVRRLPAKYRQPLVLCGLEGLTNAEAARQLGWKEGTVSGRLARARQRLRQRLLRRGVILSSAGLLLQGEAVPPALFAATLQAAFFFTLGRGVSTAMSFTLAREVLRSMSTIGHKSLALLAATFLAVATAGGAALYLRGGDPPEPGPAPAAAPEGKPAWRERLRLRGYSGHAYRCFSPNGRVLATINAKNVLQFLDTATWEEFRQCRLNKYPKGTYFMDNEAFSPDGRFFVIWWRVPVEGKKGQFSREVSLIEVETGKEVLALEGAEPTFSPTGTLMACYRGEDVILWDYASNRQFHKLSAGGPASWRGSWFSPDGKRLFVPTTTGRGKLWDPVTGKEIATLEGFIPVWSRDGAALATTLPKGMLKLWDGRTGRERATLSGFREPYVSGRFSPDGRLFLTSLSEYGLKPDGEVDFPTEPQPGSTQDKPLDLRLLDAVTGKEAARLPGQIQYTRSGIFAPDGKTVAYLRLTPDPGFRMEAVLWDVPGERERLTIREEHGLDGLLFTPGGSALVGFAETPGREQTVMRFWDPATGRVLASIEGASRSFQDPQFSPNGKIVALAVGLPLGNVELPPEGIPSPMEIRIFEWTDRAVMPETRGEPVEIKPGKSAENKPLSDLTPQ